MKIFVKNQNIPERALRLIISLLLIPSPIIIGVSIYSIVLCIVGGILAFNSVLGTCMIYRFLGINTCNNN